MQVFGHHVQQSHRTARTRLEERARTTSSSEFGATGVAFANVRMGMGQRPLASVSHRPPADDFCNAGLFVFGYFNSILIYSVIGNE
jgi:hypothetical protein